MRQSGNLKMRLVRRFSAALLEGSWVNPDHVTVLQPLLQKVHRTLSTTALNPNSNEVPDLTLVMG